MIDTLTLTDALRAQPGLARHPGYGRWVADGDEDALDQALVDWGFAPRNEDGTIGAEEIIMMGGAL